MIYFLMFIGMALSIVRANGWLVIPQFCIVFCWITSFLSWLIWSYARGVANEVVKQMKANGGQEDEY